MTKKKIEEVVIGKIEELKPTVKSEKQKLTEIYELLLSLRINRISELEMYISKLE
jgi:hypothetical protein